MQQYNSEGYFAFVFEKGVLFESYKSGRAMYYYAFDVPIKRGEFEKVNRSDISNEEKEAELTQLLLERNYIEEALKGRIQRREEGKRYKYHPRAVNEGKLIDEKEYHKVLVEYYRQAVTDLWGER